MSTIDTASIWRVVVPSASTRRPGPVIAARMTRVQAEETAKQLARDGINCVVDRA
jgi:hypothetical protein